MTTKAVIERLIPAWPDVLFDVVHDYPNRLQWDTLLRKAYTIDGAEPGPDVETVCAAKWHLGGFAFRTRYVTFRRPTLAAVTIVRPVFVFANWSASIRHKAVTEQHAPGRPMTRLSYTLTFTCRPRLLAPIIEPIARAAFRWETAKRLAALEAYVTSPETQRPTGR